MNLFCCRAMLSGLILLVFFICFCCQRSARKHEQNCRSQYWIQDPEAQLEVFTLEGQVRLNSNCDDLKRSVGIA